MKVMTTVITYLISFSPKTYTTFLHLVPCSDGDVQLLQPSNGPSSAFGGVVQICVNDTKYLVCDNGWDYRDSSVFCQYIGYSPNGMN